MTTEMSKACIALLFDRPLEPIFTPRNNGKSMVDIPESFYTKEYGDMIDGIQSRYIVDANVETRIPVRELPVKPNLNFCDRVGKRDCFSLYVSSHREVAKQLITIFMSAKNLEIFVSTCVYCKDRVNAFLFQYCFSVAVAHRKDTQDVPIKPIAEQFPANFVEPNVLEDARAEAEIVKNPAERRRVQIPMNFTASSREPEQGVAYFREDLGVNSHHWHWHLVYPANGPRDLVDKNRRGELFYYMHDQIIARYNVERYCNNLPKVSVFNDLNDPILEGYFPKIKNTSTNRTFPSRSAKTQLQNIEREGNHLGLSDLANWADRIMEAIDNGFVVTDAGERMPLDAIKGIDVLGNIIEASDLSVNKDFYGNIQNEGHNAIAFSHDPDQRFLEEFGVMGDVTTAMRDPVFYRWHGYINNICNRHKLRLPKYTDSELGYNGITVIKADIKSKPKTLPLNTLLTYWNQAAIDLRAGLNFGPEGNIYAEFTHLDHVKFDYQIEVNNTTNIVKYGTCRIFLCIKTDEKGVPLNLEEQRVLSIEMDKFTVHLHPGVNTIRQESSNSSVTIPFERTFNLLRNEEPSVAAELAQARFCGCGWPEHMLVPKGKIDGLMFDLFVMISDYNDDVVQQSLDPNDACGDSSSYCGLKDKLYPDKRSMGFPFDRMLPSLDLNTFVNRFSNMKRTEVNIIHRNSVLSSMRNT